MVPEVGSRTLRIILMVVVFPAPLGPSRPTISLRRTVNETASTATISPYTLRRSATARTWGRLVVINGKPEASRLARGLRDADECYPYLFVYTVIGVLYVYLLSHTLI